MEKKRIALYALVILIALTVVFLPGFSELQKLREDNRELERRLQLLEEHNRKLEEEIARIQEEPEYVEMKARQKLGIVRKGEVIYRGNGTK